MEAPDDFADGPRQVHLNEGRRQSKVREEILPADLHEEPAIIREDSGCHHEHIVDPGLLYLDPHRRLRTLSAHRRVVSDTT
jgi:hypothetical protein